MKENNNIEKPEPKERTKGASRTLIKDTLTRMALENDGERLRQLGAVIWNIALDGSLPLADRQGFIKLLMDRVDGRPSQSIEVSDNNTGLPSSTMFKIVKVESKGE